MTYFTELYPRLYFIVINMGFILYTIALFTLLLCWTDIFKKSKPYNNTMQLYTGIGAVVLLVIGMLLYVLLPTP